MVHVHTPNALSFRSAPYKDRERENMYNLEMMETLLTWGRAGGDGDARLEMAQWARQWADDTDCGTTLCLGGKVVSMLPGYRFQWDLIGGEDTAYYVAHTALDAKGVQHRIRTVAAEALGLNVHEAGALFMADEPKKALDFLHHLIQRAKSGMGPMSHTEIEHWDRRWYTQNSMP